jgi:hypothetical protein
MARSLIGRDHHLQRHGNGGTYFYFLCRGRQQKKCDHPYVPVDVMERAVEQHYRYAVILPEDLRAEVRDGVSSAISEHFELSDELRQQFTKQLDKLDRKERYFLDLAAEEGWPKDKLRTKITAIREEQQKITRQLDQATTQLDTGRQIFMCALDLLDNPYDLYRTGTETVRSILNRTFFPRLYIDGERVTSYELNEPFNVINEAYTIYRQHQAERQGGRDSDHSQQPGAYYRRSSPAAHMSDLTTTVGQPDLPAWPDNAQTASSADLPTETGATSRYPHPLTWPGPCGPCFK